MKHHKVKRSVRWDIERFSVAGRFTIARSSVSEIEVVTVSIAEGHVTGRGECRPYARYAESAESVVEQIQTARRDLETRPDIISACRAVEPGAAANALEAAAVDFLCKMKGVRAWELLGCPKPVSRVTAFTLSAESPARMAKSASKATAYPLLKVKVGADSFLEQFRAVAEARPDARLILDANEALDPTGLQALAEACRGHDVVLIEQPLPAGRHSVLPPLPNGSPPVCADESLHTLADLPALREAGYRAVNVKLDKAGGPVRALELIRAAKAEGFAVMAGCMVGTSLAMAPMVTVSMEADVLDLDGPLLLAEDRGTVLPYTGAEVGVPPRELWG